MTRQIVGLIVLGGMLFFLNADSRSEDTIKYDGPNNSGFGHPSGGTFYAAVRFHPEQSCTLKSIIFYQYQAVTTTVWVFLHEEESPITPGLKIDSIPYLEMPGPSSWVRLSFTTPHFRAGGVDFWISIKITHNTGQTPLGIDTGPSFSPPHSFVSANGINWRSMYSVGRNNNFNIRAIVRFIQPTSDIGIDEIVSPGLYNPQGNTITPIARIKNYGLGISTNIPVICSIFGAGNVLRYVNVQNIASVMSNDTIRINFTPWTPTIAEQMTIIMGLLINDEVLANNREVLTLTYNYNYFEDFEFGNGGYSGVGWELYNGYCRTGHGQYSNNANWPLTSPMFTAMVNNPQLKFWQWYIMEQGHDGGNVKISTNNGVTWILTRPVGGYPGQVALGNAGIPNESCYTGTSGGWFEATFNLPVVSGQHFYLRWHFGSDASITYSGWYIDDVTGIGFITPLWSEIDEDKTNYLSHISILNPLKPNPVTNGLSRISFTLIEPSQVSLKIFDTSGRLVKNLVNEHKSAGVHSVSWNCRDDYNRKVAEGIYFYTLETPKEKFTKKMVLMR